MRKESFLAKEQIKKVFSNPLFTYKGNTAAHEGILKGLINSNLICKTGKGLYSYSGILRKLIERFDILFLNISKKFKAKEIYYPATIDAKFLSRAGYFKNFPHLVKFIYFQKKNRKEYSKNVLLPAACLPCYAYFSNHNLDTNLLTITTRNKIFRNERSYKNIFTMDEFDMREIVFIGNKKNVKNSLEASLEAVKSLAKNLNFTFTINRSSDFFYSKFNETKTLYQLLVESKIELRAFCFDLVKLIPISSINYHGIRFGKAFKIKLNDGYAYTGCMAFGIERWALICLNIYGLNIKDWPLALQ